jgi:hypothetical protein
VGASNKSLLSAAECMEMKKLYQDGTLREVQKDDLDQFENSRKIFIHSWIYILQALYFFRRPGFVFHAGREATHCEA